MPVSIRAVNSPRELHTYIHLPEQIHAQHRNWLPPFFMDERAYYSPSKNKAFSYCDTVLLLAWRENRPVGRVMGIIHHPHNQAQGEKNARFAHFDCYDDEEAAFALLDAVEAWARSLGMNHIIGPFGFSDKDPQGLQIAGFDELPVMVTACNMPYLPGFVERRGYVSKLDCLDYRIDLYKDIPAVYPRIYERVQRRLPYEVLEFRKRRQLRPWIVPVFHLINNAYKDIYGFMPLDEQEMQETADRYLPILDPRFVKVVADDQGKLLSFILGLPNMTPGIQRARGRIFPFGWWHIIRAARRSKQIDLLLGAVDAPYRGRGLDILMGWKMIESARNAGLQTMESHLILETNKPMRAEFERMGAQVVKRFRIWEKRLREVEEVEEVERG
jgi:GNAT superfamily N-acetyltransferase